MTMSISTGLYPKLDLLTANKLHYITLHYITSFISGLRWCVTVFCNVRSLCSGYHGFGQKSQQACWVHGWTARLDCLYFI